MRYQATRKIGECCLARMRGQTEPFSGFGDGQVPVVVVAAIRTLKFCARLFDSTKRT